jgi:hypothetical protein
MKSIQDVGGKSLKWTRKDLIKSEYELLSGNDLIAVLRFEFGTDATGESISENWEIKRQGLVRRKFTVRSLSTGSEVAKLDMNWDDSGVLDIQQDKLSYLWNRKGTINPTRLFTEMNGNNLVSFKASSLSMSSNAFVIYSNIVICIIFFCCCCYCM